MAFMQQLARNRLAEAELILVAKCEHTANRFFPASLARKFLRLGWRQRGLLNDGLKVFLQSHASGLCLGDKAGLDFPCECKRDRHNSSCCFS